MTAQAHTAGADEDESKYSREFEWQLAAADLGIVRQWLIEHSAIEGFTIESRPAQSIYDTYLDTADWRVHRAGFALRLRDMPGQAEATLKDLSAARLDGFKNRRQYTEPLGSAEEQALVNGHGPVSTRLRPVVGTLPLRAMFRLRTYRQRFALLQPGGEAGEIALDETTIVSIDGRSNTRLRRVEVEARIEAQKLERFVDRLRTECALEPVVDSKFDAGLKYADRAAPGTTPLEPAATAEISTVRELAQKNLLKEVSTWLACEPGARLGEDPGQLRDMHEAGRGVDVLLRLFEDYLPQFCMDLRPRLKRLSSALAAVHDLDVLLAELKVFSKTLSEDDGHWWQPLRARIEQERRGTHARMVNVLDRQSNQRVMLRLQAHLLDRPVAVDSDNPLGAVVAPALIGTRYKKFRKCVKHLRKDSKSEEFSDVAQRVERLGFAIDAFRQLHGEPAAVLLQALQKLRNTLRTHQYAEMAASRLKCIAIEQPALPNPTQFLMGAFVERRSAFIEELRGRLPKEIRKITGRRWKVLRQAIDDLAITREDVSGANGESK